MYCLLCHAKIPRLRSWRTKSEFCSDEHAEAYKNQMLDRLMVNEPESAGKSGKQPLPLEKGARPTSEPETASPLQGAQPSEGERILFAASSEPRSSGSLLGLGGSSSASARFEPLDAPSAAASPKEQSAEQALAALRELAESAQRSSSQLGGAGLAARSVDPSPSEPAEAPTLRQPMDGGSEDPFDELRRLASLTNTEDAEETPEPAEEDELDVVSRAGALERLMQEATRSQPDELPESKLDELLRGEQESDEVSDLVSRLTEDAAGPTSEPVAATPPSPEETPEPADLADLAEEAGHAVVEALAPGAGDAGLEELGEPATLAAETPKPEAVTEQPEASEPSWGNVVPFPGESREDPAKDDKPAAASADTAPSTAVRGPSQDSGRGKKRNGIPLPPAKVALEPLLDLFATQYRYPAQEDSQSGWKNFLARVQGDCVSVKDVNGVIQTRSALSYPTGPTPASLRSCADLDFALFNALPSVADPPSLDVERVDAEIAGFEAACIHPELVFLNFALSTSQASGLADVSAVISRDMPSSKLSDLAWTGIEQQVAEPRFVPSVPANFLARCEDLSLSTDLDLFAGDLVFAAASMSEGSLFQGPATGGTAKLNGPRLGTAFPDRLFGEAGNADEARGRDWTAGDLVGAGLRGHDSSAAEFPPMEGIGQARSMKDSLSGAGIFEPVLETKRPLDRDLADFV